MDAQDVKNHGKSLHLASVTLSASILFQLSITKMTKAGHRSQFSNAASSGQTIATFNKLVELNEGDLCERFVFSTLNNVALMPKCPSLLILQDHGKCVPSRRSADHSKLCNAVLRRFAHETAACSRQAISYAGENIPS